jgi:hypothetical protein
MYCPGGASPLTDGCTARRQEGEGEATVISSALSPAFFSLGFQIEESRKGREAEAGVWREKRGGAAMAAAL